MLKGFFNLPMRGPILASLGWLALLSLACSQAATEATEGQKAEAFSSQIKGAVEDVRTQPASSEAFVDGAVAPLVELLSFQRAAAQGLVVGALHGAAWRLMGRGLPKNVRQVPEGYWLGGKPSLKQLDELHAQNVRLILTAASMPEQEFKAFTARLHELGMRHIHVPFGGKFPKSSRFMSSLEGYQPEQIYIHCEHGGDRSGAVLAYLLATKHGWTLPRALLAVAFPGPNDTRALIEILETRGYQVSQEDLSEVLGIYSAEYNGGYGGLKVRSLGYRKLVNTTIDAVHKEQL